jgi:long-chain acyl-CoA synthetase
LKKETEAAVAEKLARLHRTAECSDPHLDDKYFTEARAKLGGKVRICVSGGSAIAKDVLDFLKVTLCCPIVEGYGQTEVPGSICITNPTDLESGHVGGPAGGVEITLQDVPDLGYFSAAHPQSITINPSGEICVRGPNVFLGYYKAPQLTKEAFDAEGWLHTGDIGELLPSGAIKIIDRKKNLFKLSQGEYISPERVEQAISNCPLVAQCWVYGETVQDFLIAFVVPEEPACLKWAKANNIDGDFSVVATSEQLKDFLLTQIKTSCVQSGLNPLECPKKIKVLSQAFGVEQGLITPTLKLRRAALKQRFAQEIQQVYAS